MGGVNPKPLDGIAILVVDDNPDSLDLLVHGLTYFGALTVAASNGHEGLARLRSMRVDVIISDISMPGVSGYDFIQAVRALPNERTRNIPAIALTAFDQPHARAAAAAAGFQVYLVKPFDLAALVREIGRLAEEHPPQP